MTHKWRRSSLATLTVVGLLMAAVSAASASRGAVDTGLGSIDDYLQSSPDSSIGAYDVPLLGIEVDEGGNEFHGKQLEGMEIVGVRPNSPGEIAGLRGPRLAIQTAIVLGLAAGALFFPPAMLGAAMIQKSGIGESHELIIAVDGMRTRNFAQFEDAVSSVKPGEIVYLTVIVGGHREQALVELPRDERHDVN